MCQSSNLKIRKNSTDINTHYSVLRSALCVSVACACMIYGQYARAAGGCGSVCLPLESLGLDKVQIPKHSYRVAFISEYAKFDNFKEGAESLANNGGNIAIITQNTLALNYGHSSRVTVSILIPYIKKEQKTNKFGTRVAQGMGDVSIFGHYEYLSYGQRFQGQSSSIGLGLKFPSGSISDPNNGSQLPPAFQIGSGAYDLVPTASFLRPFAKSSLFGGFIWRVPLEKNRRGYKFGQEIELNTGIDYSVSFISSNKFSLQLSVSYLSAGHDSDSGGLLPGKVRDGSKVLNSGGNFLDIVPGFRLQLSKVLTLQTRISIPLYENWNGDRASNVGQVTANTNYQLTLIYTGV